jgi:energy-coupling factor transport system substrate-specific component
LALLVGVSLSLPQPALASSGDAVHYLARAQNPDGGLGTEPGSSSSQLHSGWGALGLAAAGTNPLDMAARGRSLIDYSERNADALRNTGDISRTILMLEAAGASPRSFAGRDLVAELERRRRGDGSYDGLVNQTAFAILALRATGTGGGVGESIRWIAERQNRDGGFGFDASRSDVDVTAAVVQALAAAGRRGSETTRAALDYLASAQRSDGGFGQDERSGSNAQSTAFAVQGLAAAGARGGAAGAALDYLRSLQAADGSVQYARGNGQTPVWVTAQALLAFERAPFPLAAVPREPDDAGDGGSTGSPISNGGGFDVRAGGVGTDDSNPAGGGAADGSAGDRGERRPGRDRHRPGAKSLGHGDGQARVAPVPETDTNAASDREGGSVVGGLAAAAGSALFVFGVRRRLRKRLTSKS